MANSNDPKSVMAAKDSAVPAGASRLDSWKQAIRMGIRYRQTFGRSRQWETYKQYYRGFFAPGTVPVNIIYSIGRSVIPQVYFRNPRMSVIATKPGYAMHALVVERDRKSVV